MNRRFVALGAAGAVLTLSLTGCLGNSGRTAEGTGAAPAFKLTAAEALAKTSEKTGQIDSFKANLSMESSGGAATFKMTGTMQYRAKPSPAFSMVFDQMNVAGQSISGAQEVLIGKTIYLKIPMLSQISGGKPWVKISLADLGQKTGINLEDLLKQAQQMDPVQNTRLMTASKDAREVGKETVDGVETTHYTGTYDVSEAVAKLDPQQRESFQKAITDSGMSTMNFDLWVDHQQLPRKMTLKTAPGARTPMSISIAYRDFGQPVKISAPPAGEVADVSQLMKSMGSLPAGR